LIFLHNVHDEQIHQYQDKKQKEIFKF